MDVRTVLSITVHSRYCDKSHPESSNSLYGVFDIVRFIGLDITTCALFLVIVSLQRSTLFSQKGVFLIQKARRCGVRGKHTPQAYSCQQLYRRKFANMTTRQR